MKMDELLGFVENQHGRLMKLYNVDEKVQLRYPIALKIVEEMGELAEAILHSNSLQRKEKLENKKIDIEDEFADVIITTLLLSHNYGIDIREALSKKIVKIKNRNY